MKNLSFNHLINKQTFVLEIPAYLHVSEEKKLKYNPLINMLLPV